MPINFFAYVPVQLDHMLGCLRVLQGAATAESAMPCRQ